MQAVLKFEVELYARWMSQRSTVQTLLYDTTAVFSVSYHTVYSYRLSLLRDINFERKKNNENKFFFYFIAEINLVSVHFFLLFFSLYQL